MPPHSSYQNPSKESSNPWENRWFSKTSELGLIWRLTRQDFRLTEFRLLLWALVISVASLGSVHLFIGRIQLSMAQEAHRLMGADLIVQGDKPLPPLYRTQAAQEGLATAESIQFPSMVQRLENPSEPFTEKPPQLTEIKAVSQGYPLRGDIWITKSNNFVSPESAQPARGIPEPGSVWVDTRLAQQLQLQIGDLLQIGQRNLQISAILLEDPELGSGFLNFLPRCLLNSIDLPSTGLIGRGTRASYRLMIAGDKSSRFQSWLKPQLTPGQQLQSLQEQRPETHNILMQTQRFLGLSALSAVFIAAVGILLATQSYLQRHLDSAALMRCLGTPRRQLLKIYLGKFLLGGSLACVLGLIAAWLGQAGLNYLLGNFFHTSTTFFSANTGNTIFIEIPYSFAFQTIAIGLGLLLSFTLPSLILLTQTPPLRILQRHNLYSTDNPWKKRYLTLLAYLPALGLLSGLVIWQAGSPALAAWSLLGFFGVNLGALMIAYGLIQLSYFLPIPSYSWRYGLMNLRRRAALSSLQISSLGLVVMILLLLANIRNNLWASWQTSLPADTPNQFLVNIQPEQLGSLKAAFQEASWPEPVFYPMVRGRLIAHNNRAIQLERYDSEQAKRLASREFNLSWSTSLPPGNRISSGEWLEPQSQNEISLEEGIAKSLNIQLNDQLTYNIGGSSVTLKVTSLRHVTWQSLRTNFFALVSPNTLISFPATYVTSFRIPLMATEHSIQSPIENTQQNIQLKKLLHEYPNLLWIDIGKLVGQIQLIMDKISLAIEFIFGFSALAGTFILQIALLSGYSARIREFAILRTLGASQHQIRAALLTEFLTIGGISGILGASVANILGFFIATQVLSIPYQFHWLVPALSVLGCALGVAVLGWIELRQALRTPPLQLFHKAQ